MATYSANAASAIAIGVYHVPVTELSYSAPDLCEWPAPIGGLGPNTATASVRLAYPFPSDAQGLQAFPTVSLKMNGQAVGGNPSWNWDGSGFVLSYPNAVPLSGTLVLSLSHAYGTPVQFNPANGHIASITVSTMC